MVSKPWREWTDGEALDNLDEYVRLQVMEQRGRWLVVDSHGSAFRYRSKQAARRVVGRHHETGFKARLVRYRADRVEYYDGGLVAADGRWQP